MIPQGFITEWRNIAPWLEDDQVEQDLILSRAIVMLFSDEFLRSQVAFRGGTALYKLHATPAPRYSEDIDLVQIAPGEIGPIVDAIRSILDTLLGNPGRSNRPDGYRLVYRYTSETDVPRRVKIEINTREHSFSQGPLAVPFQMKSRWFTGSADVTTFHLEELLSTKLRALYQRRKGRDAFDLYYILSRKDVDTSLILDGFHHYVQLSGVSISRGEFERNLEDKLENMAFLNDMNGLLREGVEYNIDEAVSFILDKIISKI